MAESEGAVAGKEVVLEVVFANQEAVEALEEAIELIVDAAQDVPWKEELTRAIELLEFATEHIECVGACDELPLDIFTDGDVDIEGLEVFEEEDYDADPQDW